MPVPGWWNRLLRRPVKAELPAHLRTGQWGEGEAEKLLRQKGFKVLGRRVRVGRRDEIDLIMRSGNLLVFVEVKTRGTTDFGRPAAGVDRQKRLALSRAAIRYMNRHRPHPEHFRFDIVEVVGSETTGVEEIRHIEGAFSLEGGYRTP